MTQSLNGMAERFRAMLSEPGVIILPGCYDVLSAVLLERAGFPAVFLSGYGVAASLLGNPDIGLTTLSETASVARHVADAIDVPLVVDADDGYGNEENVQRTVRELEHAGAAAMIMEDQVSPKRCGHAADKRVITTAQYLNKLEHALSTRQTPMVIIARTDALDPDEAIERATAYHEAGADVVMVDGLASLEAAARVGAEVPGHKQINLIFGGKTPIVPSADYEALGFKIVLYSTPALYTVAKSMTEAMSRLRTTGDLASIAAQSVAFRDFQHLMEGTYRRRSSRKQP